MLFHGLENEAVWNECLNLAIEGFNNHSMGIAAVVTDGSGEIISRGRNHLSSRDNGIGSICGSSVAHAEITAIHDLGERSLERGDLTLFTTVEPCPMCMGAIAMSSIRKVVIASRDPHAGSMKFLNMSDYVNRKKIRYEYRDGVIERVFFTIHYISLMRLLKNRRQHIVFENMYREYGEYCRQIERDTQDEEIDDLVLSKEYVMRTLNPEA